MEMFDSVALAYDQWSMDIGLAVRGALELFRLHVYSHFCVQKRNVVDFLAGKAHASQYVVLCSHGLGSADTPDESPREMKMGFHVVDQVDGKWQEVEFALTPATIAEHVKLEGRTVIALGCGNGRESLATAFLDAGCSAYVGAIRPVDQDATALFAIAFFYHLLASERDPSVQCSEEEAVKRAMTIDPHFKEGTGVFRYYSQQSGASCATPAVKIPPTK